MNVNRSAAALRVMLVDDDATRAAAVEEALAASGFYVLSIVSATSALLYQIEQQRPDVVLIDLAFPGRDILESLAVINAHKPIPMIMFSQQDDAEYIGLAFKAGVNTYITEGVNPEKVRPIIDVALAQFRAYQNLRDELETVRNELQSTQLVARAKALLIQHRGISETQAHKLLHRLSMVNNLKLAEVARNVIAALASKTPEMQR